MIKIKIFVFNPFQENTFVLYDETKECIVIDAGCYSAQEDEELRHFFRDHSLKPVKLLNTHCHIDHIFGNSLFFREYKKQTEAHRMEKPLLEGAVEHGHLFGVEIEPPPPIGKYLEGGDKVEFGNSSLECIHVPGHSPGSLAYFHPEQQFVIVGDVLFQGGIGRTDLPGGDYNTLINSITEKLFPLGDEVRVFSGHGPESTIGNERQYNPFFA